MAAPAWLTERPVAHRGLHDRVHLIENTESAAEAAIARGFSIECDLQITADDNAVVFHDETLDRLTDATGRLDRKSLGEIRAARIRGTSDRIPTLEELLETIGGRVPLVAEIKSRWDGDRRLEHHVANVLAGYRGPAVVMSFNPASMRAMRNFAPEIPRGLVADTFTGPDYAGLTRLHRFSLRYLLATPFVGASFIAYQVNDLPASAPLFFRHLGLKLLTWTVRREADRAVAARYADQIIFEDFDPEPAVVSKALAGSA
jgi:glycerophosphoryl diester phosphodiesterase